MVLELEWQLKQGDSLSQEEELKAEKPFQHNFKWLCLRV
jgi:hypothetical protein